MNKTPCRAVCGLRLGLSVIDFRPVFDRFRFSAFGMGFRQKSDGQLHTEAGTDARVRSRRLVGHRRRTENRNAAARTVAKASTHTSVLASLSLNTYVVGRAFIVKHRATCKLGDGGHDVVLREHLCCPLSCCNCSSRKLAKVIVGVFKCEAAFRCLGCNV